MHENALQPFQLVKDVAVYETATMYLVLGAVGCGGGAPFDLMYESGGSWAG
jgi:hypothetical protein